MALAPYVGQGAGLFAKWADANSAAAGPVYGTGIALAGVPGLKAAGEELNVLARGGSPSYRRLAAGVAEAAFAGSYGWYNAMGQNPAAGGFSAVVHGAAAYYRSGLPQGRMPENGRGPILPLHHTPTPPVRASAAASLTSQRPSVSAPPPVARREAPRPATPTSAPTPGLTR
ncbi:hypothetical protein [Actinoplanes sp. NPDC051851]|uniref:hypothetical protein n=1 Tax=Actinoplanes sp. NPDC051851 TaxID=3154753 RepID=UPI00341D9BF7